MDYQTIFGKTPVGVALAAKQYMHIPVIAICGSLGKIINMFRHFGIDSAYSIIYFT